jgi:Tfp pilus assembly protein PilF
MDIVALLLGLAVPWLLGILVLAAIDGRDGTAESPGGLAWVAGAGWLVGAFLLTLWMRALSIAGVPFGVPAIGGPLALAALALGWLVARRPTRPIAAGLAAAGRRLAGRDLEGWQRIAWLVLLGWLGLRYALLLAEVLWRPLFPWDAWAQWATKARVWFELRRMVPFVHLTEWLAAGGAAYTDPTPHYPALVPLLQTWGATLLGRWDDSLVNLPWWLTGIALALAIYGFLARQGFTALGALAGTWICASLPILNAHVALAGYADLPMAAYVTVGVLAGLRWLGTREWRDALPALLLAAAWVTIKNPGKAWLLVMLPALIVALLPRHGVKVAAAMFAGAAAVLAVLAQTSMTVLGYRLHLDFNFPARGLFDAYFAYDNWHLLWYGAIGVALLGWREAISRELLPLTMVIGAGLAFLFFGFAFTTAGAWVEDQTTVNRATLHIAPLIVLWMLVVFRQWAARVAATATARETAVETPAEPSPVSPLTAARARLAAVTGEAPAAGPVQPEAPAPAAAPKSAGETAPAVGRNDPCPCGSGRKYKHCHGALAADAETPATPTPTAAPDPDALVQAGMGAHQAGDLATAERQYRAALAVAPAHPYAMHYLGVVHYQRRQLDAALPLLERAAAAVPEEAEFHNNLGLALAEADRNDDAIAAYRRALACRPEHATAWNNLGLALQAVNDLPEAIAAYRSALRHAPDLAPAHWNLALALLAHGDFEEGWREYEWRLAIPELAGHEKPAAGPRWDGVARDGQTLLVTAEQGLGDMLHFVRLAQPLAERGVRVLVRGQPPLLRLLATAPGVAGVFGPDDAPPAYDAHVPVLSLPGAMRIDAATIPAPVPYLRADAGRRAAVATALAAHGPRLRVGLAWRGSRHHANDRRRSIALGALVPLLSVPGTAWFSLQREEDEREVDDFPAPPALVRLPERNDFDGLAALMAELDLVVSVDTSLAHLAGALARPTWLLLPFAPDWRWQLDRADSPWYPTMRLIRQPAPGDWGAVIARVEAELAAARERYGRSAADA